MADVKPGRIPYRQRQALATRRLIAQAARTLFTAHGYAATSIEAVAAEAGVSPRTVYAIFGTKKAILGAVCEEWLREAGVMEAIAAGMTESDLARRLALVARTSRRQWELDRGVRRMIGGAAASDADVARMLDGWSEDRARSFHRLVDGLEGQLRDGVDGKRAGALIRALTAAEIYSELVDGEGWSPAAYETWLSAILAQQLLRHR
ncbi:MAG TPA: helix-turn-helix domain-containing protein [Candidatus Dormibacteraeota bacterium]|nr:helix-turn-helix domain-containing protein [Candidatus Dormibacteraeota bacterium]